jgi:hypothetical protein
MEKAAIQKVNKSVSRKFPEMAGKKPKVKPTHGKEEAYELTYNATAKTANGKNIPRWVRVVATNSGKILRISTSR